MQCSCSCSVFVWTSLEIYLLDRLMRLLAAYAPFAQLILAGVVPSIRNESRFSVSVAEYGVCRYCWVGEDHEENEDEELQEYFF